MWSFFHHHFFLRSFIFIIFHFRFTSAIWNCWWRRRRWWWWWHRLWIRFSTSSFFLLGLCGICVFVCMAHECIYSNWLRAILGLNSMTFSVQFFPLSFLFHPQWHPITMMWWFFYFNFLFFFIFYHLFVRLFLLNIFFMIVNDDGGVIIAYASFFPFLCLLCSKCNRNMLYFFASANTFSFSHHFFVPVPNEKHWTFTVIWTHFSIYF